jgi:CDP-glucose 4,6-dehydratase
MDFGGAYRGARVFVTGDTGFKGSWLCAWLDALGAEIVGYALPPEGEDPLFDRMNLAERIRHTDGDLRDADALADAMKDAEADIVFHLAAQSLVLRGHREPKETFDTNVGGSVNLLEAVRALPDIRGLVFVTSDKCYENQERSAGYREDDRLGGDEPYSASKAAAEIVFNAYAHSYFDARDGFGAVSVRAGNVIGGGDWAEDRIVPDCIRALRDGKPVGLRRPDAVRPWQHVLDPLAGYMMLGARLLAGEAITGGWNFGPSEDDIRPVGELAQKVVDCWGEGEIENLATRNAPHETTLLFLNSDKAIAELGWRPRWRFDEAVAQTVGWYRSVGGGEDASAVTERQIADYAG